MEHTQPEEKRDKAQENDEEKTDGLRRLRWLSEQARGW